MAGLLDSINNWLPEGGKPYRNLVFKGDTSVLTQPSQFTPMTQEDELAIALGWSPMIAGINKLNVPSSSIMDIINNIFRNAIPFDIWNQLQMKPTMLYIHIYI